MALHLRQLLNRGDIFHNAIVQTETRKLVQTFLNAYLEIF